MPALPPGLRYFEKVDSSANCFKFWALKFVPSSWGKILPDAPKGGEVAIRLWWGRIGTRGGGDLFRYANDDECLQDARKRVEEKLREGYVMVEYPQWDAPFYADMKVAETPPERVRLMAGWLDQQKPGILRRTRSESEARTGADGWPLSNGREVRPPGRRGYEPTVTIPERVARIVERTPDPLRERDYFPPKATPPPKPKPLAFVPLAGERKIDFEE